jgi:hypothetical protein
MIWTYAGDALWVLSLTIMVAASRQAWRLIPAGVRAPIMGARVHRTVALWALPASAFLLSLWFAYAARTRPSDGDEAFILFGIRAVAASAVALLHLRWTSAALKTLAAERSLNS